MTFLRRIGNLTSEAIREAVAQKVASVVTVLMVAGMCSTILLTSGRTVGAEQDVLGSIDSAGTRSIVLTAEPESGLDSSIMTRISHIQGIEWAGAVGQSQMVVNSAFPGGTAVPLRTLWTEKFGVVAPQASRTPQSGVFASLTASSKLGMQDGVGGLIDDVGAEYSVLGTANVPTYLQILEPLVVRLGSPSDVSPVSMMIVVARSPGLVGPVARAIQSVLDVSSPKTVKLTTSENLAALRSIVAGQFGSFSRGLVVLTFAITAALVAAVLSGLVMLRRKDYGRRRALGASRSLIVRLLVTQVLVLSAAGSVLGAGVSVVVLAVAGDPSPGVSYVVATAVLATASGGLASLVPAVIAARRDPLRELRVP